MPAVATAVALLAIVGGVAYWLWQHPRVEFANALAVPVQITVPGTDKPVTVNAGESWTGRLPRADSLRLSWITAPVTDGMQLHPLSKDVVLPFNGNLLHATAVSATAQTDKADYFAPLVSNDLDVAITVTANAGLHDNNGVSLATSCDCSIPAHAVHYAVGMYPLYRNSTLEAATPDGRVAMFENLGSSINRQSGRVSVRFRTSDMHAR